MATNNLLVFLVDDDRAFARSIEHTIKSSIANVEFKVFSTGEECLEYLPECPDIIFLDYRLNSTYPKAMNGIKTLDKIRDTFPRAIVILMSVQTKLEIAINALKEGAFDYIIKDTTVNERIPVIIRNCMHSLSTSRKIKSKKNQIKAGIGIVIIAAVFIYLQFFKHLFSY